MKNMIKEYDISNQINVLTNSFKQIEYADTNTYNLDSKNYEYIDKIIICGMGGSAIGGDLFSNMFQNEIPIPIFVNRYYHLPNFVSENSLVIISSYSGNTEETTTAFNEAIEKKCKVIAFSTGGRVEEICTNFGFPHIKLLKGFHPRFALYLILFTLIKIFSKINLIKDQAELLNNSIALIQSKGEEYVKDNSLPEIIAKDIVGFIPIIYATSDFNNSVGSRLKGQFNENSKLHAFVNFFPEMNHNEIIGWETYSENLAKFKIIFLTDKNMNSRVKKRFEIFEELVNKNVEVIKLESNEKDFKLRLLDLIYLGDWLTYYLAIYRKQDPAEIDNINYLKNALS